MSIWDAAARILTNTNALLVLIFLLIFFLLFVLFAHTGILNINIHGFKMGADHRERDIIRQQIDWAHSYILGLKCEIEPDESTYSGYLALFMLEAVYDEVVNWITFNHINLESDYISIKQEKIKSIIHSEPNIRQTYKSKDFDKKVDKWVDILIRKLVLIRKVYK